MNEELVPSKSVLRRLKVQFADDPERMARYLARVFPYKVLAWAAEICLDRPPRPTRDILEVIEDNRAWKNRQEE